MLFIKASEVCLSWADVLLTHPSALGWKQNPIAKAHGWLTTFPIATCHFRAVQGQELFPAHKGQLSLWRKVLSWCRTVWLWVNQYFILFLGKVGDHQC